jgi:hypothetical protein
VTSLNQHCGEGAPTTDKAVWDDDGRLPWNVLGTRFGALLQFIFLTDSFSLFFFASIFAMPGRRPKFKWEPSENMGPLEPLNIIYKGLSPIPLL